jgi:hypothetical protein
VALAPAGVLIAACLSAAALASCSDGYSPDPFNRADSGGTTGTGGRSGGGGIAGTGGRAGSGGAAGTGGRAGSGGAGAGAGTGGRAGTGGAIAGSGGATGGVAMGSGGALGPGGALGSGGRVGSGGAMGTGGAVGSGGAVGTGGALGPGGALGSGGRVGSGGAPGTGGAVGSGGAPGTGGATASGGAPGTGGATASGGSIGTGGASTGTGGAGGPCATGPDLDGNAVPDCQETLVANSGFDTGIAAWTGDPTVIAAWTAASDGTGNSASGALVIKNGVVAESDADTRGGAGQCVAVTQGASYSFFSQALIPATVEPGTGYVALVAYFYGSSNCSGTIASAFSSGSYATIGAWGAVQGTMQSGTSAGSMSVRLEVVKRFRSPPFEAHFDNVLIKRTN